MSERLVGLLAALALAFSGCGSSHRPTSGAPQTETNPTGMTSSTPLGASIPAKVTPIHAVRTRRVTSYTIGLREAKSPATYRWMLSPPSCGRLLAEAKRAIRVSWHRSCLGEETVHVSVTTTAWQCSARYFGIATGTGPQPACIRR